MSTYPVEFKQLEEENQRLRAENEKLKEDEKKLQAALNKANSTIAVLEVQILTAP